MRALQQMADGMISVHDGDLNYGEDATLFASDFGRRLPQLPAGITSRIYQPGVCHALKSGSDVVDGGPLEWPEGDAVIAAIKALVAKRVKREDDKLAARKREVAAEVERLRDEAKQRQDADMTEQLAKVRKLEK